MFKINFKLPFCLNFFLTHSESYLKTNLQFFIKYLFVVTVTHFQLPVCPKIFFVSSNKDIDEKSINYGQSGRSFLPAHSLLFCFDSIYQYVNENNQILITRTIIICKIQNIALLVRKKNFLTCPWFFFYPVFKLCWKQFVYPRTNNDKTAKCRSQKVGINFQISDRALCTWGGRKKKWFVPSINNENASKNHE